MLILDIEAYQINGKSSIWDFGAIDTVTGKEYHFINAPLVTKACRLLRADFNIRFFEQHHVDYCLSNQTALRLDNREFFEAIQALINKQKVISAYNLNFDYRELRKQGISFPAKMHKVCLWGSAVNCLVNHKYVKYAYGNNYVSERGNVQTSAEIMYRYVSGDDSYIHQHTALSDCWSELVIWEAIKKKKQKLASSCSWSNVQQKLRKLGYAN